MVDPSSQAPHAPQSPLAPQPPEPQADDPDRDGQVRLITMGCRLNTYESEVMRAHAEAAGHDNTVIVNTCAVTQEAVRQARQAIRKAARERPGARIIVTGCAAQVDPEPFAAMAEVSQVLGNAEKMEPASFLLDHAGHAPERVRVNDIMAVRETAHHMIDGIEGRTRAFVQIQNGCDHRCTFCIIPYGRGNSRSVPAGSVVEQIARLTDAGTREVVLTGVDLTAYGNDLPGTPSLGRLVRQILTLVPDLPRLRLSSLDTIETDPVLEEVIATEARVMPHLHLSLQAGDDLILKRMKRRHARRDAEQFCQRMRAARPNLVFGADLIAGFPTETDAMFENTLEHVEACGLTYLHVFPYSPRPGTPAARMPQVQGPVIRERAARLRDAGDIRLRHYLGSLSGTRARVLMESGNRGRTESYAPVTLARPVHENPARTCQGDLVEMTVFHEGGPRLTGHPV